jgi:hypothetical protein
MCGALFSRPYTPSLRPTQPSIQWIPGGKARPRCDADHSPPSSAEVKNEQDLYLLSPPPPSASMACSGTVLALYAFNIAYIVSSQVILTNAFLAGHFICSVAWAHVLLTVKKTPWYFSSWASGEPHHSGFKSQLVALSLWCVMFLVWQFFVGNVFNVVLVLFPDIFVNFCSQFRWPQLLLVWQSILCSTFYEFLYLDFYTLISFQLPFTLHSYLMVLLHQSIINNHYYYYYY